MYSSVVTLVIATSVHNSNIKLFGISLRAELVIKDI